jgi:uncharacterized protein YcbX
MSPRIEKLVLYPLKGARGAEVKSLLIDSKIGIHGDRRYGIKRKAEMPDTWQPKGMFHVCMNTPSLARFEPSYDREALVKGMHVLHPDTKSEIKEMLKLDRVELLCTNGEFNLTDTQGPEISILNLASVRALSDFVEEDIDPRRFRMNVWIDGLEPFEELEWVNSYPGTKEITIGQLRFRVDDVCERCKAIEASMVTGTHDMRLLENLEEFMKRQGYPGSPHRNVHKVMGIMAVPLHNGQLVTGDIIKVH